LKRSRASKIKGNQSYWLKKAGKTLEQAFLLQLQAK
jgi:hypothetical protein